MISHPHDMMATPVTGPVLAGLLSRSSADDVLRAAFVEADSRNVPLTVLIAASLAGDATVPESIERWTEKFPRVTVAVSVASGVDPAITMTAATGGSCLAVLPPPVDALESALLRAVTRRSRCPVLTAGRSPKSPVGQLCGR